MEIVPHITNFFFDRMSMLKLTSFALLSQMVWGPTFITFLHGWFGGSSIALSSVNGTTYREGFLRGDETGNWRSNRSAASTTSCRVYIVPFDLQAAFYFWS